MRDGIGGSKEKNRGQPRQGRFASQPRPRGQKQKALREWLTKEKSCSVEGLPIRDEAGIWMTETPQKTLEPSAIL